MSIAYSKGLGDFLNITYGAYQAGLAGGSGDASLATTSSIDRMDMNSGVIAVPYYCALATDETAKLSIWLQDSADDSTYGSLITVLNSVTLGTGTAGDSVVQGVKTADVDLSARKQYIKIISKMDLSASGTDTSKYFTVFVSNDMNIPT